jgi:hypothetical protein
MTGDAYDVDGLQLSRRSADFARRLFSERPGLRSWAAAEMPQAEEGLSSLTVQIPPQNPALEQALTLWMEDGDEPSLGFGEWHTHAGLQDDEDQDRAIIRLLLAILADEFVLVQEVGGDYDGHFNALDLRDEDALLEELTSPYFPGCGRIVSWTGQADRLVDVHQRASAGDSLARGALSVRPIVAASLRFLPEKEHGRACMPVGTGYAPHLRMERADSVIPVRLICVPSSRQLGEEYVQTLELLYPDRIDTTSLVTGVGFQLLEGKKVVATGKVVFRPSSMLP